MTINVAQIVGEILEALFAPLTEGASAIATVIQTTFVDMLFVVEEGAVTGLNAFGTTMLVFGGISLVLGLTYLVYNLIRSKIG